LCLYVTGYHAGLWDNCHYNVTENVTLEACLDKLTRELILIELVYIVLCCKK